MSIATPEQLTELRLKLHANGYRPVPVVGAHVVTKSAGKRPTMEAWETKCLTADAEEIARWPKSYSNCTNTGILGGHIVGVDIDVLDETLSAQLSQLAHELLGPSWLHRIGRAPKVLLVYRVANPIPKIQTPSLLFGDDPDTKVDTDKCKVEILAEGSQFVGFGIHPDTKAPYRWPYKSPLDVPFADVPLVTPEKLQQFVAESEAMLRAAGARTIAEIKKAKKATEKESKEREATAEKETKERAATVEKETEKLEKQGYASSSGGDFFKQVNARHARDVCGHGGGAGE
jgi:putative DNA primase/helicase